MITKLFATKLGYIVLAILVLIGLYQVRYWYHDDSFITLRYAMNFLDGHGLVWNPGETPVEGYSNFLFLMFVVLLGASGIDLVLASKVINIAAYAGIIFLTLRYLQLQHANKTLPNFVYCICALLLATDMNLILWSVGGLEAVLLAFLLLCGALLFIDFLRTESARALMLSSLFLCLGGMTRLDAGLFIAVTGLFLLHRSIRRGTFANVIQFSIPCLIFIPYFLGKYWYYGDILPNTFYAKASGMLLNRLASGSLYNLIYLIMPPFLFSFVLYFAFKRRDIVKKDEIVLYLLIIVCAQLIYMFYSGGDHMRGFRFYVPIIPLIIILYYHLASFESQYWNEKTKRRISGAVLIWMFVQITFNGVFTIQTNYAGFIGSLVGKYINAHFPKGSVIALNTAGSPPYFAPDNTYIDMLGLNDPHIARKNVEIHYDIVYQKFPGHNKGDGEYILSRKPDYIIVGPASGILIDVQQWFYTGYELSKMDQFYQWYEPKIAKIDVSDNEHIRDWYSSFMKDDKLIFTYYQRRPEPKL